MKEQPEFEKVILQLYKIKNPTKRVQNLVDELALVLIGENYVWPKPKA